MVVGLVSGPMNTLSVFSGPMKWCEAWVVTCWTGLETFSDVGVSVRDCRLKGSYEGVGGAGLSLSLATLSLL